MTVKLITGTPGAGKTLSALEELFKMLKIKIGGKSPEQLKAEIQEKCTRQIVCIGIEGLIPGLFDISEDPLAWQEWPDGTIFVVDEAWKWFGAHIKKAVDGQGNLVLGEDKKPIPFSEYAPFLALAEHRHRGFDFILTAQMPSQIHTHLKGLVGEHVHVTRKFGTSYCVRYEWPSICDNPNSQSKRGIAQTQDWIQPKEMFALYQSATIHNIKRKIPWRIIMIPVVAVLTLALFGGGAYAISTLYGGTESTKALATTQGGAVADTRTKTPNSPEEYLAQYSPRVASQPWSAPIYDTLKPSKAPRVFCMSSPDHCTCMTEQGTPWVLPETVCRTLARWGQYEPLHDVKENKPQGENRSNSGRSNNREFGFGDAGVEGSPEHVGQEPEQVKGWLKY